MHTLPVRLLLLGPIPAACAARSTDPADRPLPSPPALAAHGLLATLTWNPAVDLDLDVSDPSWVTLCLGNKVIGLQPGETETHVLASRTE